MTVNNVSLNQSAHCCFEQVLCIASNIWPFYCPHLFTSLYLNGFVVDTGKTKQCCDWCDIYRLESLQILMRSSRYSADNG